MSKCVVLLLMLAVFSFAFTPSKTVYSQASKETSRRYVEGEIIIKLKDNVEPVFDEQMPEQVLRVRGAKVEALSRPERGAMSLVRFDPSISVEEAARRAKSDPRVEFAEPNFFYTPADTIPNDEQFGSLWGLKNTGSNFGSPGLAGVDISATRAWDITRGSDNIVAAVIDTGVYLSHPDLAANAWVNQREIPGNNIDDDDNGFVDDVNGWNFVANNNKTFEDFNLDSHGTHVAGTIGAVGNNATGITGVAWHVKLMSLKFIGRQEDGRIAGTSADAVKAINYAIDMKKSGVNLRVINASWAGPDGSNSLRKAINKAGKEGILFVCAAGNGGDDNTQDDVDAGSVFPAGWASELSSVVSVTSINALGAVPGWANYGHTGVSVAAPGTSIVSTFPGTGYGADTGTSMSTPHVAGIAVLLWTHEPSLEPSDVKKRIISTAEPVLDLASRAESAGRANAYNALTNRIPPPASPAIKVVSSSKKILTIDGLGVLNGLTVIQVNGVTMDGRYGYDEAYKLANNSFTRVTVKVSKSKMKEIFPIGQARLVNLYNPATAERSSVVSHTRN